MKNQKVALITGANRGIGFETAKQLGEKGITVIVSARQLAAARDAAEKLKVRGIDAYAIQLDVTQETDRKAAAAYIMEKFGKLDILINNGAKAPKETLLVAKNAETTAEEFSEIFEPNFFGLVYLTNDLLPLIKASEAGRIVNVSSILGSIGSHAQPDSPIAGYRVLSYNAAKAALNMFTVQLANELKETTNIKVNSAYPGWVKTELGTDYAPMEIPEGAKTSVDLALLGNDGYTGKFIHLGEELPW
jgi:NAD(P)-dependent dehydrogenase (short-subunit alcohol dehydrogenase family)